MTSGELKQVAEEFANMIEPKMTTPEEFMSWLEWEGGKQLLDLRFGQVLPVAVLRIRRGVATVGISDCGEMSGTTTDIAILWPWRWSVSVYRLFTDREANRARVSGTDEVRAAYPCGTAGLAGRR
jgi:hypothetical protein